MPKKRILVLMKRFGSNRDMVKDNFGREIRLFEQLVSKYDIDFICPDYYFHEQFRININGVNFFVVPASFLNPFQILFAVNRMIKIGKYDLIVPTTEPILGIIGYFFAKKFSIKILYEVQDNYETYASYKLPFVKNLEYNVIKKSDFVFYSNYELMKKFRFLRKDRIGVVESGVDLKLFKLIPKDVARKALKINENIKLVTYTGSISKVRGIDLLIEAIERIREIKNNIYLLLSGKVEDNVINVQKPWIFYKELPKREQVVQALNASDVLVIPSTDNPVTRYAFPQKLFEYMSVNVPIAATAVGDVKRVLLHFKESLCMPNSADELRVRILSQLGKKSVNYRKAAANYTWEKLSKKLDKIIKKVIERTAA